MIITDNYKNELISKEKKNCLSEKHPKSGDMLAYLLTVCALGSFFNLVRIQCVEMAAVLKFKFKLPLKLKM
jgi:hypothetical protein